MIDGPALAFIDTETLGLDPDLHPIWEVGLVVRHGVIRDDYHWFVEVDAATADPEALEVNGFLERYVPSDAIHRNRLAHRLREAIPEGAFLVGNIVSFDEERLRRLMVRENVPPPWHHRIIDVEAYAAGVLGVKPPWRSDDLAEKLGVEISDEDRHTALGDARWAMRMYDAAASRPNPLTMARLAVENARFDGRTGAELVEENRRLVEQLGGIG